MLHLLPGLHVRVAKESVKVLRVMHITHGLAAFPRPAGGTAGPAQPVFRDLQTATQPDGGRC